MNKLKKLFKNYYILNDISGILFWDNATNLPSNSITSRSEVMNNAIPQRRPSSVMELWTFKNVLSFMISLHHIKKVKQIKPKPVTNGHNIS